MGLPTRAARRAASAIHNYISALQLAPVDLAIAFDGAAYLFTAPSGTGKTTHLRLWRQYLGSRVTVAAEAFGTEPTEGVLRAATRTRYTIERRDDRAGTLHVHFPRVGFVLREVRA